MSDPLPSNQSPAPPQRTCPQCGVKYQVTGESFAPFCSRRCQQLDLANWLGEKYGLPYEDPHADAPLDETFD